MNVLSYTIFIYYFGPRKHDPGFNYREPAIMMEAFDIRCASWAEVSFTFSDHQPLRGKSDYHV